MERVWAYFAYVVTMLSLVSRLKRKEQLPPDIYVSLVDWLYQNSMVMLAGSLATAIAVLITACKTDNAALWMLAIAVGLVAPIRAIDMQAFAQSTAPRTPEMMYTWELRYIVGAGIFHLLLGLWCLVALAYTDDHAAQLISCMITVAYAATGAGEIAAGLTSLSCNLLRPSARWCLDCFSPPIFFMSALAYSAFCFLRV